MLFLSSKISESRTTILFFAFPLKEKPGLGDELEDVKSTDFKHLLNSIEYNVSKIAKIEKQLETNKKKIEEISIEYLGLKEIK